MGNGASIDESEFQKQIKSFSESDISIEHIDEINMFFKVSSDFTSFFTSCNLEDFRKLRKVKPQNLIFLMSQAIKVMSDVSL